MDRLRDSLLALGVPGLFLIALLDSAGVPLPGSVDLILILLAWQKPSLFLVIALVAAAGSTVGCLILYRLGRTGGEVALRRLDHEKLKLATEKVRKNDVLAIVVADVSRMSKSEVERIWLPFMPWLTIAIVPAYGFAPLLWLLALLAGLATFLMMSIEALPKSA